MESVKYAYTLAVLLALWSASLHPRRLAGLKPYISHCTEEIYQRPHHYRLSCWWVCSWESLAPLPCPWPALGQRDSVFLALKSETWILLLGLIDLSDDDGCMEPPRVPNTRALVILPSPTSFFPTTPSSLHQSSNVPSFINLVHALARLNLWYFPSCLCESTSKWWFSSPVFSSFLTFTLDKASPVHNRPWLTESDVWFG